MYNSPMRKTKVFQSGDSQAIRLPKEFRISSKEVYIEKFNNGILITREDPWNILRKGISDFTDDLVIERNQPEMQKRDFD